MPPYLLTVRFPYIVLGSEASESPELVFDPKATHEKKAREFYEVDSQVVAEKLLDLFGHGNPAPLADLKAPVGTVGAVEHLLEWVSRCVLGMVDMAELGFAERVRCRERIAALEEIESACDWDFSRWGDDDLRLDRGTELTIHLRHQAEQWEPLVRDELGADDATQGQRGSTAAKPKGAYLWFTYGTIIPLDPRADINEKFYFHKVDSEDLAARLVDMFQKSQGEKLWFGYTTVDALDVGETILADASVARYQKGEVVGEDSDFSVMATRWERQLREKLGVGKTVGRTAESAAAVKHDGTRALPAKPPSAPTEPLAESTNGGKPSDALLEKAKTPSAPETHSKSPPAPSGENKVDAEFSETIPDQVHTLLGPSAPSANSARLRTQIVAAIECHDRYREAVRKWRKQCDEDIKQTIKEQHLFRQRAELRQHAERPPREGSQWVDDLPAMLCDPRKSSLAHAFGEELRRKGGGGAWVPADLLKPPCFPPNPMPGGDSSEDTDETVLMRCYVALAVVHDRLDALEGRTRARLLAGFQLPPHIADICVYGHEPDKPDKPFINWGKGFERTRIEQALEAVRLDLGGRSHEQEASPVTLKQFMEQYCKPMTSQLLKSRVAELQHRARHGAIDLPACVGQWRPGKSKYFRAEDLCERWPSYLTQFPALPKLKSSRP